MAVYKVQGPDGKVYQIEGPDGASDAEISAQAEKLLGSADRRPIGEKKAAEARSLLPDDLRTLGGFVKESGANAVKGLLRTTNSAMQAHPFIGPLLNFAGMKMGGQTPGAAVEKIPAEDLGMWGKTMQAAGGGMLGAPSAAMLAPAAASGAMGELGAEAAGTFAGKTFGKDSAATEIARVLGGLTAGGATAFALGPRQNGAQAEIREAAQGTNWDTVQRNLDDLQGSGAKTATLAEAFPQGHGVRDLANLARAGTGSNDLRTKMVDRQQDLSDLGGEFLNRIGPPVDANKVSERVAQAANAVEANLNELKNTGFRNRVAGASIRPDLVKRLEDTLLAEAQNEVRGGPKGAYREIAAALRNPDTGELITSVPELSKVMYGFQTAMKNGSVLGKSGNTIAANDMNIPLRNAREGLGELSPPFQAATDEARAFNRADFPNQGPRGEFAQSPLKKLADRNPNLVDPTPASRLEAITSGTSEQEIAKVLAALERDPGLVPGQGVGSAEIARALYQQRLKGAPTNPGGAVRGNPGSASEGQMEQILRSAGLDPQQTAQPLRAADLLQGASAQGGLTAKPKILPLQWLIRTLRSADMTVTGKGLDKLDREVSRLLADPEMLAEVRKIAAFDPAVRRQLMLLAPTAGQLGSAEQ